VIEVTADEGDARELIRKIGDAINQFVNGDAEAFKACWLHESETSIFGGRGDHEIGWEQVSARLDWAASGFTNGWTEQEVLVSAFGTDYGYTVSLERGEQTVAGRAEASLSVLRVTHIFRRGRDGWGIVHRHADPVISRTTPEAILVSSEE
jgi:ketosteroid isomerase-like protein